MATHGKSILGPWDLRPTPARHDADGNVFIAYFRPAECLGFMWDGNIEHPVQVTRETSEPVTDTFELASPGVSPLNSAFVVTPPTLFHHFKQACDQYADNFKENR